MPRKADPITRYARAVVKGRIVTGKLVKLACQRHLDDLKDGPKRGLRWDIDAAVRAINFFPDSLKHSTGEWAGQPLKLEPWQMFRVGSVFGWKRADGSRRYRTAYNCVARKNGKSTEAAGIGLYMQYADGEGGAQVYSYATKKEQARIVFDEAANMVRKNPRLKRRIDIYKLNMSFLPMASKFEPLSADVRTQDGLNPHCAIGDELHAHSTGDMYDVIKSAFGARRQPLHWIITTRGMGAEGICYELDEYAVKVLKGILKNDSFFAYIACLDEDDAWDDPDVWIKANPGLGVNVKMETLEEGALEARGMPTRRRGFKVKCCNIWTEPDDSWIEPELWQACGGHFDADDLLGQECYGGLDLSGTRDLTALVLVFPDIDGTDKVLPFFWLPEDGLDDRSAIDKADYRTWAEMGFLRTIPGAVINKKFVARDIAEICGRFNVKAIGYDRYRMLELLVEFDDIGFQYQQVIGKDPKDYRALRYSDALPLVDWGQGYVDMPPAINAFEESIVANRLRHGDNPILLWCVANISPSWNAAGEMKFDKKKSQRHGRIDGAQAAAMAFGVKARMAQFEGMMQPLSAQQIIGTA